MSSHQQMVEDFALACIRANKMMLDNVGISINEATLPTWAQLKADRDRLYGSRWLSRIWCQWIRPRLMPTRQRRYLAAYQISETAHRVAFMAAVLEQGEKMGYVE